MMKIGIAQYDIKWNDPVSNLLFLEKKFKNLKECVDIMILPEMFAQGFMVENPDDDHAQTILEWMILQSKELEMGIIGSMIWHEGDARYNRLYFIGRDRSVQYYDKYHLFTPSGEHDRFNRGTERIIWNADEINILPQICYDLRFPVFSRNKKDYNLAVYSANWPKSRQIHWETLLRARAIENQSYVVGVNRLGKDGNGVTYFGGSIIYDYKGNVVFEAGQAEGVFICDVNFEDQKIYRSKFPFLDDADNFTLL